MRPQQSQSPDFWHIGDWVLYGIVGLVFCFLVAPSLIVIPISFSSSQFMQFPPPGFSPRWYQAYLGNTEWIRATLNSLQIATVASLLATALGILAALGLRHRTRGQSLVNALLMAPLIVPPIVLAVTFYFFYVPFTKAGIPLIGSRLGLALAHTVLGIPYVVVTVSAALKGFDVSLERAAQNLGATPFRAFWRVTLPLIRPGVMSGALFAFITSFDELVIAIFLSSTRVRTLPVKMWEGVRFEIDPTLAAVSTLLIAVSVGVLSTAELLRRRVARLQGV